MKRGVTCSSRSFCSHWGIADVSHVSTGSTDVSGMQHSSCATSCACTYSDRVIRHNNVDIICYHRMGNVCAVHWLGGRNSSPDSRRETFVASLTSGIGVTD